MIHWIDPVVFFRSVKECRSRVSALEARVASIDDDVGNQVAIIDKTMAININQVAMVFTNNGFVIRKTP